MDGPICADCGFLVNERDGVCRACCKPNDRIAELEAENEKLRAALHKEGWSHDVTQGALQNARDQGAAAAAEVEKLRARVKYYEEAVCLRGNPIALPPDGTRTEAIQTERAAAVLEENEKLRKVAEEARLDGSPRNPGLWQALHALDALQPKEKP